MNGNELRERRQAMRLTQAALAERLGVTKDTVSRWERGARGIEHPDMLRLALERLETQPQRRARPAGGADAGAAP